RDCLKIIDSNYVRESKNYKLKSIGIFKEIAEIIDVSTRTIIFDVSFKSEVIIDQLKKILNSINKQLSLNYRISEIINESKEEILVCIICLLHSSKLRLYDGTFGDSFISASIDHNVFKTTSKKKWNLRLTGSVAINSLPFPSTFSWPIMNLEFDCSKYLPIDLVLDEIYTFNLNCFNAKRLDDGSLRIVRINLDR
ncbi:MAG: hypothetical protein K2Q22_15845, partial [Cytophagales bacterium]|nr:hypothetical protein [Cytophagales bacterium]